MDTHAQTPTVIDHLPHTINAGGLSVLTGSFSNAQTSGNLITVAASNVTVDIQGNYISGPGATPTRPPTASTARRSTTARSPT